MYVSTLHLTQIMWELFNIDSFSWLHLTVWSVSSVCRRISKFGVFLQWFLAASSSWTWLWEVYYIPMKSASITNEKGITQLLVTCFSATLWVFKSPWHVPHPSSLWQSAHWQWYYENYYVYFNRKPITYKHKKCTHRDWYIHTTSTNLRQRPHQYSLCVHNYMCFILRCLATNASHLSCGHTALWTLLRQIPHQYPLCVHNYICVSY